MTTMSRGIANLVRTRSARRFRRRRTWLPSIGSLMFATALIVGLSPQIAPTPGKNVLVGPGGTRLHIQKTDDNLTSFTPYTPGELWGGGSTVETCLACQLEAASGKPAGQSVQSGQQVNPATGDFSYSLPLFSVPATGGMSLGLDLHYDSQEAEYLLGCAFGGCNGVKALWPDFGVGWAADQFPSEGTWTDSNTGISWIQAVEPNGSLVTFQAMGSSPTSCPQGDNSNELNYTIPSNVYGEGANQQYFCAPYRVNAQVGQFSSTYTVLDSQDGKSTYTFDDATGTPEYAGNIANQDLLTYNTSLESAGSHTCPATADTGAVTGCWTVADATRTLTVVVGTPSNNSSAGSQAVLAVIDPEKSEVYDISWGPSNQDQGFDEPASIQKKADLSVDTSFYWDGGNVPVTDEMTQMSTDSPAGGSEVITYGGLSSQYPAYVTSTTDQEQANPTSYGYLNETSCGLCLGAGPPPQTETTTVTYPDGEVDVDSYTEGILESDTYGTGSDQQTVSYGVNYQNFPISETFTGPAAGQTTLALTDGVNITQLTDAEGNVFTSVYDPVTAPNPPSTFDELCWTAPGTYSSPSCQSPPSGATSYAYDSYGDVASATDPLGNETRYGYNSDLGICWVAPPTITASGSACGEPIGVPIQAPTGSTAYQYDAQGDLNCQFVAYGESDMTTTEATYNTDGQMTDYDPPDAIGYGYFYCNSAMPHKGYDTSYVYTNGELTKKTAPNSQVTTYTYNSGLLEKQKDPTGITTNAYDADGRLCWTARASLTASVGSPPYLCSNGGVGSETAFYYLADTSAQTAVVDPAYNVTTTNYADNAYPTSPTKISDPAGESIVYNTYDANGNLCDSGTVATTTCESQAGDTYYTYDGLDEDVASMQDASGNTTTYGHTDSAFPTLVTSQTDALGTNAWTYKYDTDGRLYQSTDPSENTLTTGYDHDNRQCFQEVGSVTTYTCSSLPSGTGDSAWTYNLNGTLGTMSDNLGTSQAATTTYAYDAGGNQTTVVDDNGNTVNYSYNVSGQVSCIGYPGATKIVTNCSDTPSTSNPIVTYGYDGKNRLSSTTDWLGNETTYGYSSNGLNNLTSISYPTTSADSVTYGFNTDSRVASMSYSGTPLSSVPGQSWGYNSDELITSATQLDAPSGTITSYTSSPTYDSSQDHNWIASNTNPGASGANSYAYKTNGELVTDTPSAGSATSYGYNADDGLCWSVQGSSSNGCGTPPVGATTYTSTNDGQRCWSAASSIANATCASPPSVGATGYAWNSYGELCWTGPTLTSPSCGSPPTRVTKYSYDGNGERTSETSPSGATEDFVWDSSESIPILLQDGTYSYIYGPTLFGGTAPIEQINLATSAASYLASAPSGVQLVLSQGGSIVNESSYSTYGKQSNSSSAATSFGFAGGYTDATGLLYLINRYYDPSTGQFLSIDPLVQRTGQPYSYGGDDPINLSDPSGLLVECDNMSGCGSDSGDHAGPTGIGCSQNCGSGGPSSPSAGYEFLLWLSQQSQGVQVFFQCMAAHGLQACENFFGGGGSPASPSSSAYSSGGGAGTPLPPQMLDIGLPAIVVTNGIRQKIASGICIVNCVTATGAAELNAPPADQAQVDPNTAHPEAVKPDTDPESNFMEGGGGFDMWYSTTSTNSIVPMGQADGGLMRFMNM